MVRGSTRGGWTRAALLLAAALLAGCATTPGPKRLVRVTAPAEPVVLAEAAVAAAPGRATGRLELARAYLAAGRFVSAAAAYRDALTLDPGEPRAVVGMALMEIVAGRPAAALNLIDGAGKVSDADAGLVRGLAGDLQAAVVLLDRAARMPGANARTRQNLALVLALAGRWQAARAVASEDLAPAMVDQRLGEWAHIAGIGAGGARVAALLGVRPVADPGQPVALTLAPLPVPAPSTLASIAPMSATPLPQPMGRYVVQLGAFSSEARARDAWAEIAGRVDQRAPLIGSAAWGDRLLVRLSVGGFAERRTAWALCRTLDHDCFVRRSAGDRRAGWAAGGGPVAVR